MLPVIFIHRGPNTQYLKLALKKSPDAILIGDEDNCSVTSAYHPYQNYFQGASDFKKLYQHRSTNPEWFEMFCFQRWFVLYEFMEQHSLTKVFVADSDVLLYCDVSDYDYDVAYSIPKDQQNYRWSASAHVSYWTINGLRKFCEYILWLFEDDYLLNEKWQYHKETGAPGGIADMTALYLFSTEHPVKTLTGVYEGMTFDHQMNRPDNLYRDEYEMGGDIKRIDWRLGKTPYGYNKKLDCWVKFNALHFQGNAKQHMEKFV